MVLRWEVTALITWFPHIYALNRSNKETVQYDGIAALGSRESFDDANGNFLSYVALSHSPSARDSMGDGSYLSDLLVRAHATYPRLACSGTNA